MTSTMTPPMSEQERRERDERLARLAARRSPAAATPAPASGRHHAARGSRTAALALSAGTTVGLATFLHGLQTTDTTALPVAAESSATNVAISPTTVSIATSGASTVTSSVPAAPTAAVASAASTASPSSGLTDGSYTGDTFTNRWGPVQVEVTISGGEITAVDVLQVPDDDRKSVSINNRAVPTLVSETLAAQSADIDSVSGATYTSVGYRQSLQSAIDAALTA